MSSNVVLNILSEFKGKKAFKQADTAVDKLSKSAKNLGRVLGVSLGAAAVGAFSRNAVRAFAADEKAAVQLTQALKNLGLGFATATSAQFISDLEKSANIADDQLRPAFQALITTTGSLTKSQELLNLAIETSRGSGVDLVQTSQDIANAYVGNTKGLKKYYLGLTQAELKTATFAEVQAKLNEQFSGSNAAYLNTTAGKIEAISVAAGNASEQIGGSLVNAFIRASGSDGVDGFVKKIYNLSDGVSNLIDETARFMWITKYAFNPKNLFKGKNEYQKALKEFNNSLALQGVQGFDPTNNALTGYQRDRAAQIKAEKDAAKRAKELIAAQKKNTAELKKQAALKKSATLFDLEQIQLIAALKGNLSEEEQKRVRLQLALLTENTTEAQKLTYEIAKAQGLGEQMARNLATLPDAKNPFASWAAYLDMIIEKARLAASIGGGSGATVIPKTPPATNIAGFNVNMGATTNGVTSSPSGDIIINVQGSVTTEEDLVAKIRAGIQSGSLSGKPSDIGRLAGMFG